MSVIHNKKRNAILMYEFLIRTISKALCEGDKRRQSVAVRIIKRYYSNPNTELYKEFRLANAIYRSSISSYAAVTSILNETKQRIRSLNVEKLNKEKSSLINEVNKRLNDDSFYDYIIPDYKIMATIQTLFNEWNTDSILIDKLIEFEDKVSNWLLTDKSPIESSNTNEDLDKGTTRLAAKLINQKFNEKYSELNNEQRSLIRSFVLSEMSNDTNSIKTYMEDVKSRLLEKINNVSNITDSEKLSEVKQALLDEDLNNIDNDMVTRFLLYSHLTEELSDVGEKNVK